MIVGRRSHMKQIATIILILILTACGDPRNRDISELSTDSLYTIADELGWIYQDYDSAEVIYEQILKRDQNNKNAIYGLIGSKLHQDEYQLALELTDSLTLVYPSDYWFNLYKGQAVERLASIDSAKHFYIQFMELAGDTIWYINPALIAITEGRPLTQKEVDDLDIDRVSYRNELLNYANGGWHEMYRKNYDTSLFFQTNLTHSKVFDHLENQGINALSVVETDQGVKVYLKKKFLTKALELGLTATESDNDS